MRMRESLKRGKRYLENPPKRRTYKRPVTAYVHYESAGGEKLAFAFEIASNSLGRYQDKERFRPNVVPHKINIELAAGHRLVALPSEAA